MMFVVVNLHGFSVNVRLKCVERLRKRGHGKWHSLSSCLENVFFHPGKKSFRGPQNSLANFSREPGCSFRECGEPWGVLARWALYCVVIITPDHLASQF